MLPLFYHKLWFITSHKLSNTDTFKKSIMDNINPHKPVAQKVAEEVIFRRFQGEGVEFF